MSTSEICETQSINNANGKAVDETFNEIDNKLLEVELMTSQPLNTQNIDQTCEKSTEEASNEMGKLTEFQSTYSHVSNTQNIIDENEKSANELLNKSDLSEFRRQHFGDTNEKLDEELFNKSEDKLTEISNTLDKVNNISETLVEETLNENGFELSEFESAVSENITHTSDQLIDQIFNPEVIAFKICDSLDATEKEDIFNKYENAIVETFNQNRNQLPEFELITFQVVNTQGNKEDEILVEKTLKENENKLSERESPTSQVLNTLEETFKENGDKLSEFGSLTSQVFNTQNSNDRNGKSVDEISYEKANPKVIQTSDISDSQHLGENVEVETFNESGENLADMTDTQGAVESEEIALNDSLSEDETALPEFEFAAYLKTTHKNRIYGVQFYNDLIFATVGGNNVTIYECDREEIKPIKTYVDPNENEIFYTCCWSQNPFTSKAVLSFAGFHGILKVVYPMCKTRVRLHYGHGRPINHLTVHPRDPSILLSASDDQTLRLWNIESGQCFAVFSGVDRHKAQVVHDTHKRVNTTQFLRSQLQPELIQNISVPLSRIHYQGHSSRVDCVKWHGNLILSKSIEDTIICWAPGSFTNTSSHIKVDYATVIHRFDIYDCYYWFVRFSVDSANKYMAIGNNNGKTFVWSLDCDNPTKYTILEHEDCTTTVRQTAFSSDGKILICCCDDNTVFRWNLK